MDNIVLIVMDTARADAVDLHSDQTPMPRLAEFAQKGTSFSQAHANAPWTLPSHGTIFSGQYPSRHQAHADRKQFDYEPTLAQLLGREGYRSVAVSNNTWISREFGFDRGFDEFYTSWQLFQNGVDFGDVARTESGTIDKFCGILRKFEGNPVKNIANLVYGQFFRKRNDDGASRTNQIVAKNIDEWTTDKPLFLFINYLEPHLEYHPPDSFSEQYLPAGVTPTEASRVNQDAWGYITGEVKMTERDFEILRGLYRAEIAYLDKRIAELRRLFDEQGVLDETTFIITGDHGENIGEHGLMDHQYSLHQTLLNVPLTMVGSSVPGGELVQKPVGLVDLVPTVLDIAGASTGDDLPGYSLTKPESIPNNRTLFAEYLAPQPAIETLRERYNCKSKVNRYDRRLRAVIQGHWKYVRGSDGSEWLFNLEKGETKNFVEKEPTQYDELVETLDDWVAGLPETANEDIPMSGSTEQRLEDLGYLQ